MLGSLVLLPRSVGSCRQLLCWTGRGVHVLPVQELHHGLRTKPGDTWGN